MRVDVGQIGQVIQNLTINADQAMPNGGTLTVVVENVGITQENSLPLEAGEYVQVSMVDQGVGIQQNQINQIFDPYFSTKETGHGLGLSICHSIITRHNGYITAKSGTDIGSTFTFYLPASFIPPTTETKEKTRSLHGTGHILLMDDEEIIHITMVRVLNHLGYEVRSVYNGQEALQAYQNAQQQNTPFDLVIMDLTIPGGMGGKETVRKLRDIDPNARVIVASGYANDPILTNPKAHGFDGALNKPIELEEMSHIIKQVLA